MTDVISRSAVLPALVNHNDGYLMYCDWHDSKAECESAIRSIPALDAVPVVRCIACRYFKRKADGVGFCVCGEVTGGRPMMRVGEDFCSYGERMDGEADG